MTHERPSSGCNDDMSCTFVSKRLGRATKRNLARTIGHVEGVRRAEEVVEACRAFGVEVRGRRTGVCHNLDECSSREQ